MPLSVFLLSAPLDLPLKFDKMCAYDVPQDGDIYTYSLSNKIQPKMPLGPNLSHWKTQRVYNQVCLTQKRRENC
jgi:hypothetical protein